MDIDCRKGTFTVNGSFEVMSEEAGAFRNAFKDVTGDNGTKIRLSIICVQVNSNYRLFRDNIPATGNAAQQNVPPGTCVDTAIVHPTQTEFILVAHKSIMVRCPIILFSLLFSASARC